jgi:integrase
MARPASLCRCRHNYNLRHTYATVSLDVGVNPKVVSERIGHASLAFTLQTYTHRSEGSDREAAQTVASLFVPLPPDEAVEREGQADGSKTKLD